VRWLVQLAIFFVLLESLNTDFAYHDIKILKKFGLACVIGILLIFKILVPYDMITINVIKYMIKFIFIFFSNIHATFVYKVFFKNSRQKEKKKI